MGVGSSVNRKRVYISEESSEIIINIASPSPSTDFENPANLSEEPEHSAHYPAEALDLMIKETEDQSSEVANKALRCLYEFTECNLIPLSHKGKTIAALIKILAIYKDNQNSDINKVVNSLKCVTNLIQHNSFLDFEIKDISDHIISYTNNTNTDIVENAIKAAKTILYKHHIAEDITKEILIILIEHLDCNTNLPASMKASIMNSIHYAVTNHTISQEIGDIVMHFLLTSLEDNLLEEKKLTIKEQLNLISSITLLANKCNISEPLLNSASEALLTKANSNNYKIRAESLYKIGYLVENNRIPITNIEEVITYLLTKVADTDGIVKSNACYAMP